MKHLITKTGLALALGLGLMLILLLGLGKVEGGGVGARPRVVLAAPGHLFVTTDGTGTACTQGAPCTLQTALSQATTGETIYVAQGTYTGTGSAVVTVTNSITLYGGWDGAPTGEILRDPGTYPTTFDGENQRRVVYINGRIAPTLDGFIITGGDATNASTDALRGGGIYSNHAGPLVTNNVITDNVACRANTRCRGGGIYLVDASASTVVSDNLIISNTANTIGTGQGGGLYLGWSRAVRIRNNTFQSNVVGTISNSMGGGMYLISSPALVSGNLIQYNVATPDGTGFGGGLYTEDSSITFDGNTVISNTSGHGALAFARGTHLTATNNIIAQNVGGVFVRGNATYPFAAALSHNTIADNGDGGIVGWWYTNYATLILTNNIIVSHTNGIDFEEDDTSAVTATYTLFYGNDTDVNGDAITSTHEITGSAPRFVDPEGWNYHVLPGSPAIDAGVVIPWLTSDIDGEIRPNDLGYDIGADEAWWSMIYLPLTMRNS